MQPGSKKLEDVVTIAYVVRHGFQNVRGGNYVLVDLPCPPPPIAAAALIQPSASVAPATFVETMCGHVVQFTNRLASGDTAWMARIAGAKALQCCPGRGFKTIYAADQQLLKQRVLQWLQED